MKVMMNNYVRIEDIEGSLVSKYPWEVQSSTFRQNLIGVYRNQHEMTRKIQCLFQFLASYDRGS